MKPIKVSPWLVAWLFFMGLLVGYNLGRLLQ
jgi:hypothetical protein